MQEQNYMKSVGIIFLCRYSTSYRINLKAEVDYDDS